MRRAMKRRGSSAVEFGLSLPWVLLSIVSMCDFAMWTLTHHAVSRSVQDAASVGSRVVIPEGDDDGDVIIDTAEQTAIDSLQLWGTYPSGTTVAATWKSDDDGMMWLTVDATVPYTPIVGVISPFNRPIQRRFVVLTQEQVN